jgi:hypothetical protein
MPRNKLTTVAPEPSHDGTIQVEVTLPLRHRRKVASQDGELGLVSNPVSRPEIPRITRLMALAIKFQDMIDRAHVRDYADLARLGYVSRARLTQIMNLRHLAPDIQANLLDHRADRHAPLTITERDLRVVSRIISWVDQRHVLSQIDARLQTGSKRLKVGRSPRKGVSVVAERYHPLSFDCALPANTRIE